MLYWAHKDPSAFAPIPRQAQGGLLMNPVAVTDELRMLSAYGFPEAEELPLFA